jgi:basic membrane protein A
LLDNVQPSENRTATLIVAIPENATPGTRDNITITATSTENAEVSGSAACIAQVLPGILIVADDDASSWIRGTSLPEFESALTAAGYDYFVWKESTMGHPSLEFLTMFKLVIWTCGGYWSWAVDSTDAETLEAYLAQGGNIFLEGEDIGYNHHADNFMVNVAHAIYQVDDTGAPGLTVTDPSHPVTRGLPTTFSWLQNPPYDDGVTPTNGGFEVIQYTGTPWTAVTVFDGGATGYGSVIYYAFPIYCLWQSERDMLVINSANWIMRPVHVSILPRYQEGLPGATLEYTVTVINRSTLEDTYDLAVNDDLSWALTLSENQLENVLPGERRTGTLGVTIPENATPGNEDKITVTAISAENTEISDSSTCIAHAVMARLSPPHSDYGLDTDNDNLYNYLVVEAKVAVATPGWYEVYGSLRDNEGNWITSAWADNYLEVGIQTLELRFKGYEIERSGRDGPYHVYLDLYSWDYGWIDSGEHETEAYTHDQFQPPPANLFPPHSDYGLDTDNDNLYNYLVVEVGVEVEKAGRYQVSSSLYDNAYNYITGAWAGSYLDVGIQTIELRFYGGRINSSGRDGPYRVYLSLYDNEGNWLDSGEHETTAYSHDQFQPPPFTIYIENDDFFTPGNGVNGDGSGTVDNPYIIENWVIDASCVHGIWIRNTTKYFIIRNCLVENGGDSYYGICLENVVNGKIENNTVGNNFSGIQFEYSDNNIISNNIMRKNLANGVRLDYSHNNLIENNIAENNGDDGIELGESENNFILNNVAENNRYNGVVIWNSDYNIIENNLLENNYYGIYFAYGSDNNLIENNTCSNNSSNGIELDSYSDNNTISGNICSNNYYFGISLFDSSNNVISNNIAENTRNIHGIILDHSDNNLIENNTVRNNQQSGIQIHLSSNNTISNNIVEDSRTYEGILIQDSNNNLIENNLVENNQTYGIDLYEDSDNNIISGNICSNNLYDGIVLFSSDRNLISNNTCKNNDDDGIDLNSSSNNTIDNNLVENNYYQEIRLEWSPNNTIFNNIVENTRSECGIFIWGSDNNLIENNTTKNNNISGIYLNYSNNNLIKNNIGENDRQSIELYNYSDNNRIENNIAENNRQFGIILNNSSNNALSSNTCSNNLYDGIVLYSSNNNLISNNTCKNNGRDGIDLYYIYSGGYIGSDNNTLDNNTCSNNSCGIYLSDSDINTITNNTCSSNNSCGIYLRYSLNNRIFHNNFVNNAQQARDGDTNYWDNGYPSGGNYWSDYTGVDNYQGENQDIPGSDGIGDMPYYISGGGNRDRYPLVVVAPILVWPASCENINDNTPTFVWTSVTDQSGVTYQIQIDDSPDFSSPVYFAIDLTENTHTLPDENALALFVQYFWRIRAVDGVGNASDWSGEWNFTVTTSVTFTFNLWKGWNMISFPVMPDNKDPHSIFPGDYTMFRWDAENKRYVLCTDENIENGVGYWVYVSAAENVVVSGTPVDSLTLPLSAGWNLIGSPLGGASIANPNDTPDNSVLPYAFTWDAENRRYTPPITDLVAGAGYWVYALDNCVLKQPGEIWVAIVTDIRGRGDMSFNDMGFKGCDLALEQGIVDKVTEVISTTPEDYLPNLRALASSGDYDLIIPIGYLLQGATYTVAKEYPQQNFACIDFNSDSGYPDYTPMGTLGALGVLFREEQSGAIEGVIAALIAAQYSKPQVGIVLGMEIPPVIAYEIGFRYGLYWGLSWYENKFGTTAPGIGATSTKIIYQYTDAFDNPALGKTTAQAQLAHDLAVCWGVAGQTGLGVFDAVEEYHNDHSIPIAQPPFIMGVDADQDWMKPGLVISSAMKRIDQAVVRICQLVRDNEFKSTVETTGGILRLGMTEGAAGASTLAMLDDLGVSENIKATVMAMRNAQPAWVWEGASALENKILSGEITILRVTDHDTAETYRTLWA